MRIGLTVLLVTLALAHTSAAGAQAAPQFDAASIRSNRDATGVTISIAGGTVRLIGITTRQLLTRAFGVEPFDIQGEPGWVGTDRFDIIAKAPATAALPQINAMLRALLADRWSMKAHVERRASPVFFLVTVRDDGRLGPSIKETADATCGAPPQRGTGDGAVPNDRCRLRIGASSIEATGQSLFTLASRLATIVGRPVIDRTGATGRYDFTLNFAPERDAATSDAASLYTALAEQLGLRLESRREPVDTLIIDTIQRPSND